MRLGQGHADQTAAPPRAAFGIEPDRYSWLELGGKLPFASAPLCVAPRPDFGRSKDAKPYPAPAVRSSGAQLGANGRTWDEAAVPLPFFERWVLPTAVIPDSFDEPGEQ